MAVKAAGAARNKAADHRFRAASSAGALCVKRTAKNRWTDQKMNEFIFWLANGFFLCPEAFKAASKLQTQIVCYIMLPVRRVGSGYEIP